MLVVEVGAAADVLTVVVDVVVVLTGAEPLVKTVTWIRAAMINSNMILWL
jgi:hypothetical protein